MENSFPLHICNYNSHKLYVTVNRAHLLLHSIAIAFLVYYRASFLFQHPQLRPTPIVPWLLVFVSELLLSFMWLLGQGGRWRPVSRTVFPERLPEDSKLPGIDVFICTADPDKEPTVEVMNTVLSAMALDYPAEKLHVYLSDDGGAAITLHGMREAWKFARWWLPFCRRYGIKTRCPNAYFSGGEDEYYNLNKSSQFMADREKIQEEYEKLKEHILRAKQNCFVGERSSCNGRNHSPIIEVINKTAQEDDAKLPLLVYVSREKRPSRPHHFKAGALNVLLRVSGVISNSPCILVLDCDMYCNDPTSAKQAMCFHLDPIISSSLAFVQFPQLFRNITSTHIYDDLLRFVFKLLCHGMDGLKGPIISGTNFYIKRESLFSSNIHQVEELKNYKTSFGLVYQPRSMTKDADYSSLLEETKVLASCTYEDDSKWGDEVGFMYNSVVEDFSTSLKLHCGGWKSVYFNPSRPQFLGISPTNLNDVLIQNTRWNTGLLGIGISRFCPLIYGPSRMSFLQSVCYAQFAFLPLYCLPLCCFGIIPQLCLLGGISLYPEVSSSFFLVFAFIFTSAMVKHLYDVTFTGGSIQVMINEQRIWMMKSVTCHVYGSLDAIMKILGLREDSFLPTNKVENDDQVLSYQRGKFDFQTSTRLLAPIVTIIILNLASFFVGIIRIIVADRFEQLFVQVFLSFHILAMNYPIIEGMLIRKDRGCIPPSVTLISVIFAMILWALGSPILMY